MLTSIYVGLLASSFITAIVASTIQPRQGRTAQLVAYYGQAANQDRLSTFCDGSGIDIFPIGFVNGFTNDPGNNGYLETNFGNQCGGYFGNTKTFTACQTLIEDISYCQSKGKKILISIGGGVSSGRLTSDQDGIDFANQLWQIFGPKPCGYTGPRPFGDNVVDGFDFDIEQNGSTGVAALTTTLRNLMDADKNKSYLLTAAPQCVLPDAQLGVAFTKARFDYIWIQYYNTPYCSAKAHFDPSMGGDINFNSWVSWLKANSPGTPPQVLIGLPASNVAAPNFYITPDEVQSLLTTLDSSDLFGGIMLFDAMTSRQNTMNGQDYASTLHNLLDARGFARAAAVPNNGYSYSCANTGSPSSTPSTSSISSTIYSTTSIPPYLTQSTTTTPTTPTTSTTITTSTTSFNPNGLPYGIPPYSSPTSLILWTAGAKHGVPAIPMDSSTLITSSTCSASTVTSTTIISTTATTTQVLTVYASSPNPSPSPNSIPNTSIVTTVTPPPLISSPLTIPPIPTLTASQSPTVPSTTSTPSIQPYAGGAPSTVHTLHRHLTILIAIFTVFFMTQMMN